MKKFMMTLAAVLCCALTTSVFTACGSDDDDPKPNGSDKKYVVNMYFDIALAQGLYEFCDVYCTYTNKDGEVVTIQCPQKGYYDQVVDYDKAPDNYEFSLYAVPKEKLPEIDSLATYSFKVEYYVQYSVGTADKPKEILNGIIVTDPYRYPVGQDMKGKHVLDFLEKHRESYVLVRKKEGKKSK
ncbi:MAG: hypothetical protein J5545_05705 [Bacteroidaceae bacterium]|nr:hypothetical protein [Bacteroidaceae bacterium]